MDFVSEIKDDVGYLDEQKGEDEEKKEDDLPEIFSETDELDDDLPDIFGETEEDSERDKEYDFDGKMDFDRMEEYDFDGKMDFDGIEEYDFDGKMDFGEMGQNEEENKLEPTEESDISQEPDRDKNADNNDDQSSSLEQENESYENLNSESTSTVLTSEIEESMEPQEQEEEIEIPPEEYQDDSEPIVNTEEIEFVNKIEELAEFARETKGEDEILEPQVEQETAAYHAEKYYEKLKEKEVLNERNSKEEQEIKEVRHEVKEESKNSEELNGTSKEITSTEEFEYLWNVREKLEQEGKSDEDIKEVMHEAEEMYKTLKEAEKLYEEKQQEILKQVNHEDQANEEDLKEDLDKVDLIEQAVELEENLTQQGKSQEEIDENIEKAIERTKHEEDLEKIHEQQEQEKFKLGNHEDEASVEDLKEDLDRLDLIEQAVDLEENLTQQGKSQEEIDVIVEEAIEITEFDEDIEKLYEQQEQKKLKHINHEDEASVEDTKEEIDQPAEEEYYMEAEEELHRQRISQEEINERMEEIANDYQKEITEKQKKEEKPNASEMLENSDLEIIEQNSNTEKSDQIEQTSTLHNGEKTETYENVENKENFERIKPELEAIESESEEKKETLEESSKVAREKTKEEENEQLQELYRQETGKRPIYAKEKTKGYTQWLEQRELRTKKIQKSQHESEAKKEIEEEDWKTTLKQWIREASEDECNAELKSELKKALESYKEFEDLTKKLMELYEKSQHEKLSEQEKNRIKSFIEKLQKFDPVQIELLANIRAIKKYINEHWWEIMNRFHEYRVRSRFFEQISQKYKILKQEKIKLKELISLDTKMILMNQSNKPDENIKILLNKNELTLKGYNYVRNEILREHKDEAIYSKILQYADIVLKKQIKLVKLPLYKTSQFRLTTQQKLVDIYEGKDYVTEKDKYYEFVNKYRDYEALVYLIKCKNGFPSNWFKGKRYFGYTHSTEKIRFRYHIREAIEQYMDYHNIFRSEEPTKLNRAICIALEDLGYRINEISFLFEVEDVYSQIKFIEKLAYELEENYFDVINLAFHKKLKTAINHEIKVIAEHGATSELNERGGGQGGQPYIPLPLYDIVGMIALGCTQKRIWKLINKLYKNDFNRDKIAENTLRRRIIEEFKGWVNAQKLFLKPMVEALVYKGFSDKKIYSTLSKPHSKEGWLYAWWKNGEELDFRSWPELDESKIKKILKNSEEKYCGIHKSKWEEWVINEVPNYEIANITKLTFETIVSIYKDIFGGRNNILFKHRRETTIKMREEGMSLKEIYTSIFNKTYYPSNFTRDFKTWFDGMTPKQIEERWGSNKVNK